MKILITGAAGFIGFHLSKKLINEGFDVYGIDNLNDYYDVNLKLERLKALGIDYSNNNNLHQSNSFENFVFNKIDITDYDDLKELFKIEKFDKVCNLAAQAGVRYSIENPWSYIKNNIDGFLNILECCKDYQIKHLIYASSSSVYGNNKKMPLSTADYVDNPISLYAATKKSNELMAHTYSHLFDLPTTGLRFFTVYGPWGRPDMALFLFTKAIKNGEEIKVFNHGNMIRDFTYVDDIVEGIRIVIKNPPISEKDKPPFKVYNIGNSKPEKLLTFIEEIEKNLKIKSIKKLMPMQPGDVPGTFADISEIKLLGYKPKTDIKKGIKKFIEWYLEYFK